MYFDYSDNQNPTWDVLCMNELVTNVLGSWGHVIFGMANLSEKQYENKKTILEVKTSPRLFVIKVL